MYDFDTVIDRRDSGSAKWAKYQGRDVLPFWVADMDFRAPPFILEALQTRLDHGIFGYSMTPPDLVDAVVDWLATEFDWAVSPHSPCSTSSGWATPRTSTASPP